MTSHLRHAIGCSGTNNDGDGSECSEVETVQSFASFCVSVLLGPTSMVHGRYPVARGDQSICGERDYVLVGAVQDNELQHEHQKDRFQQMAHSAIRGVAGAYINGEPLNDPIEILFRVLMRGRDFSDDENPSGVSYPSSSGEKSELEIFQNDLESCLENSLLHEYLSTNWNRIDDYIWVNKEQRGGVGRKKEPSKAALLKIKHSRDDSGNCKNVNGFSWSRGNWEKTRKAYFQKPMQTNLSFVRMASATASQQRQGNSCNIGGSSSLMKDARKFSHWRSPTVYFLGGGMGAGKTSVLSYLRATDDEMFQNNPVVVEADAFKHSDPVFHALNALLQRNGAAKRIHRASSQRVSQLVHDHSTNAANQQLVMALANQRDVIVDGTMTWMPYVRQTIAMVRDAHKHRYLLGPGYSKYNEQYWERAEPMDEDLLLLPYRVEMVGVTADAEHAVPRSIRRAIITGRGVPIRGQLRSHRLYSEHFPTYADSKDADNNENHYNSNPRGRRMVLFDRIRLFDTTSRSEETRNHNHPVTPVKSKLHRPPPRCIAWRDSPDQPLSVISDAYERFLCKKYINDAAIGVADLYRHNGTSSVHMHDRSKY